MKAAEIQVMNLDHLGLVAGIIDEIGLVEQIDQLLGQENREKVSRKNQNIYHSIYHRYCIKMIQYKRNNEFLQIITCTSG